MSFARRVTELEEENAALRRTIDRLWDVLTVCHKADFRRTPVVEAIKVRDLNALLTVVGPKSK